MKRPAFQFYTGDWQKNAKLRRCSHAARGAWIDVLCLLHDSEEYGVLRWPLKDIAQAAGAPLNLVRELVTKEVLKGADKDAPAYVYRPRHAGKEGDPVTLVMASEGPCWYSSRFVRDEWVRLRRGQSTQFSSDNQPPKGAPNEPPKGGIGGRQGDGPSSSSSSSPSGNTSEAKASAGAAGDPELTRAELWASGKSLLSAQGMPAAQCGTFVGKLVKDYGEAVVVEAVRTAVVTQAADAATYLVGLCKAAAKPPKAGSKHAGFAAKNYREGVTEDGSLA